MSQGRPETLATLFSATEASVADRVALSTPAGESVPYAELAGHVARVGAALRSAGIEREDRVGLMLPNGLEAALTFLGVAAHAVCAPLDPASTAMELERVVRDLRLRLLVVVGAAPQLDRLGVSLVEAAALAASDSAAAVAAPRPGDVALLLATSGTTSRPKLVPLTHANLCASAGSVAEQLRLGPADRGLSVMPLFHVHGLVAGLLAPLTAGGSVVCTPGFDSARVLGWLEELGPTWLTAVPTMYQALLAAAERSHGEPVESTLRLLRSSSAPLPPRVLAELERVFRVPVVEAYGMTEAAHQITSNPLPPGLRKPGSVGLPAGTDVAIHDGEIVIRGLSVMTGYVDDPAATAAAFTEDGWFRTGDAGELDEDGYLTITGRLKELINRGGEKVAPREVDDALTQHPAVGQAAAFAIPHPTLGEEVGAAVVLRAGAKTTVGELRTFAAGRLAPGRVPRRIVLVDDLPRGPTGKVQRLGLAEALGLDRPPAPGRRPRTPLEAGLAAIWAQLLGLDRVGIDQDFFLLGGDSLVAAQLVAAVGETLDAELPLESLLEEAATVAGMAELVERRRAEAAAPRRNALQRRLFEVQPHGSRAPLFYLEPSLVVLRHLLPTLGPDQPVLGPLMAPVDENPEAFASVEAIAEYQLRTVREAQPSGPYFLAGHSFVGLVAYELAWQLRARGETVALLLLLDTICPPTRWTSGPLDGASRPPGDHDLLSSRYTPPSLDAPTTLLYTRASALEAGSSSLGWEDFVTAPELHEVDGDHRTMLQPPRVRALVEQMAAQLESAQAEVVPAA